MPSRRGCALAVWLSGCLVVWLSGCPVLNHAHTQVVGGNIVVSDVVFDAGDIDPTYDLHARLVRVVVTLAFAGGMLVAQGLHACACDRKLRGKSRRACVPCRPCPCATCRPLLLHNLAAAAAAALVTMPCWDRVQPRLLKVSAVVRCVLSSHRWDVRAARWHQIRGCGSGGVLLRHSCVRLLVFTQAVCRLPFAVCSTRFPSCCLILSRSWSAMPCFHEGSMQLRVSRVCVRVRPTMQLPSVAPLSTMINDRLKACDAEIRKELCSNLLVVGGGAAFKGVSKRLSNELASLIPMVSFRCVVRGG